MSDTIPDVHDLESGDSDDAEEQEEGFKSDAEGSTESNGQDEGSPDDEAYSEPSSPRGKAKGQPSIPLSQRGLYHYDQNMTDRQRQEQDERNFAGLEQKKQTKSKRKIRSDKNGNLFYTEDAGLQRPVWKRAIFHHWIREDLIKAANRQGTYQFPRGSGLGRGDETSYHAAQRAWGTTRRHYAPVMFDFERLGRTNPIYNIDRRWEHRDRVVIDYWLEPVRSVNDMPTALSSNFEGDYMEPIARIDSRITIRDFIARMPPFIVTTSARGDRLQRLYTANAFSRRMRFFRARAGAISWNPRDGSATVRQYIDSIHAQQRPGRIGNSTHGCQDLTKEQQDKVHSIRAGQQPHKARPGASARGKEKWVADTERMAGKEKTKKGKQATRRFMVQGRSSVTKPASSGDPSTDSKSSSDDTHGDSLLYQIPDDQVQRIHTSNLLRPTLNQYQRITNRFFPGTNHFDCYAGQHQAIERDLARWWQRSGRPGRAPQLIRLEQYNEKRAVWNMAWNPTEFGAILDLANHVEQQIDGSGTKLG